MPRFQRSGKRAEQSAADTRDHVVERRRVFGAGELGAILLLIEMADAAVDSEVESMLEAFDQRTSMGTFVFLYEDAARVCDGHGKSPLDVVAPKK